MRADERRSGAAPRFAAERRVRWLLALFFVALAAPSALLIGQAYRQLRWEAFRQTQLLADEVATRIDADLRSATAREEARPFSDYQFLVVQGDAAASFVQRSPLSSFPVVATVPGTLGYFQVDPEGALTTPLLPPPEIDASRYGISEDERRARLELENAIRDVLAENRLARRGPTRGAGTPAAASGGIERGVAPESVAEAAAEDDDSMGGAEDVSQAADEQRAASAEPAAEDVYQIGFDRLADANESSAVLLQRAAASPRASSERRADEFDLDTTLASRVSNAARAQSRSGEIADEARLVADTGAAPQTGTRQTRIERTLVPEPAAPSGEGREAVEKSAAQYRVSTFASELEPFELGALETGQLVLFRNAWREGERYVQGLIVDRDAFLGATVGEPLGASSLAGVAELTVAHAGDMIRTFRGAAASYPRELAGALLQRSRLSPPFGNLELIFTVAQLPRAPGSVLLIWVSVLLTIVLCAGFALMYRFAVGQVRLARQQQDFVSAVGHELRTPLTSIRMYGEMLRAGWVDEARRQTYYDYIHGEAERLSRLIENVMQLARLTRNTARIEMRQIAVTELFDSVRSKVSVVTEREGFQLVLRQDAGAVAVDVDPDCFVQIMLNLIDNAVKFSRGTERKVVEIGCRREGASGVLFTVRDYGPGIPKGQLKKIFQLFYRPPSAASRAAPGTGLGLALVKQLVEAMHGRVDVRNCAPGAEFRIVLPSVSGARLIREDKSLRDIPGIGC